MRWPHEGKFLQSCQTYASIGLGYISDLPHSPINGWQKDSVNLGISIVNRNYKIIR